MKSARRMGVAVVVLAAATVVIATLLLNEAHDAERVAVPSRAIDGNELRGAVAVDPRSASGDPADEQRSALLGESPATAFVLSDLLRVVERTSHSALNDVEVWCFESDGARHRLGSGDRVRERDLDRAGLWVVTAAECCPGWIDPAAIAELVERGAPEPFELALVRSASIEVIVDEAPAGAEPLERVDLRMAQHRSGTAVASRVVTPLEMGSAPIEDRGADLRALCEVRGSEPVTPESVARARSEWLALLDASAQEPDILTFLVPWLERSLVIDSAGATSFTNVPAGEDVVVVLPAKSPLTLAEFTPPGHRIDVLRGDVATAPLSLEPGEVVVVRVGYEAPCGLRGRFPAGVLAGAELRLEFRSHEQLGNLALVRSLGVQSAAVSSDGHFVWPKLVAGSYRLEARWQERGGVEASVELELELAPGEQRDLGVLAPSGANSLTIVPRLVPASRGVELPPTLALDEQVVHARLVGPLGTDAIGFESGRSLSLKLVHEEAVVVAGLEAGIYSIQLESIAKATDDPIVDTRDLSSKDLILQLMRQLPAEPVVLDVEGEAARLVVAGDTAFELDIPIAPTASCTLVVPIPPHLAIPHLCVYASFYLADSDRVIDAPPFSWEGTDVSGGVAGATTQLPSGAWTAVVQLALPATVVDQTRYHVGRVEVELSPQSPVTATVALEPGASIAIDTRGGSRGLRLAEFPGSELHFARSSSEGHIRVARALLPDTDYVLTGGSIVHTGAPGSVVEVP